MLATSSNEIVVLTTKNKTETLGLDEFTKWLCLLEAVEYIEAKATEVGVDLDESDEWIKPLALQKYVKERFVSMRHDVKVNLKNQ